MIRFQNGRSPRSVVVASENRKRSLTLGLILLGVMQPALIVLHVLWQHNNSFPLQDPWLDYVAVTASLPKTGSIPSNIPHGRATALPALLPESTAQSDEIRPRQGMRDQIGEPLHLGGILTYDKAVISPNLFELLRKDWGIRSMLDIGCGRGWSTLWFHLQGVSTQCVEASRTALKQSLLPSTSIVNHDFTRGPWWPDDTTDLVWSIRFVQQVSRPYMRNYFAAMSKAAILLVSFPRGPGWHHVEVHDPNWWIVQFELQGFRHSEELTEQVIEVLQKEIEGKETGPNGEMLNPAELEDTVHVFINPRVASLPAHAHLFPEFGCYKRLGSDRRILHRECNTSLGLYKESSLPSEFAPPTIDLIQHKIWEARVRKHLDMERPSDRLWDAVEQQGVVGGKAGTGDESTTKASQRPANISHHAVMHIPDFLARGNHSVPKIPVVVWPLVEFGPITAEALHIETNGIQESPLLHLSDNIYNFDPHVVWVGDTGYAYGWEFWCGKFNEQVKDVQLVRSKLGLPTSWPIFIVDWADYAGRQRCYDVEKTVGGEFVFYTKRGMTAGRVWNANKGWVEQGKLLPEEIKMHPGIKYRHTPLIVRTDIVENLQIALRQRGVTLRDKIETLDRPIDVTHVWPVNATALTSGVGGLLGQLRSRVSEIVLDVANTTGLKVYVGVAGAAARTGRREVQSSYVDIMLNTKIMIVTQRDEWEDHYRLFEALISGAMVMTDRMLSLPVGLKNGTSIVEFSSEAELRSLMNYYANRTDERLAIAHEGRRIAMMRHRTWHRVEEIIFGRALTLCSSSGGATASSGCPYIVHANETSR